MSRLEQLNNRYEKLYGYQLAYKATGETVKFWRAMILALDVLKLKNSL